MSATTASQIEEHIVSVLKKSAFLAASPDIPSPSAHQSGSHSSQGRRVDESVSALIALGSDLSCFAPTLRSLLCQSVLPSQLIIAVCTSGEEKGRKTPQSHLRSVRLTIPCSVSQMSVVVLFVGRASSFGDCVNRVISSGVLFPACQTMWLLHDDSRPNDSEVLHSLTSAFNRSPGTYLVGAKQIGWRDSLLQSVGYFIDRFGRRVSLVVDGQEDQGQYDSRQDVFGVSLAGALVSLAAWKKIGGADPWYGTFGESYDVSRKIWRCGGRVAVESHAVIAHRRSRFEGIRAADGHLFTDGASDSYAAQVVAREKLAATQISAAAGPFVWLYSLLESFVNLIRLLIAKEPFRALCEFGSPWVRIFLWGQVTAHRIRLRRVGPGGAQFDALIAHHDQLKAWRTRQRVFEKEKKLPPVNPLGRDHLHRLALVRSRWVLLLAVIGCGLSLAANWPLLHSLASGSSLTSTGLVPTGATLQDAWSAASIMYSTAWGLGAVSAPLPFALVLVLISCLGLGNLAAGISVWWILFLPLAMLAFFALAGTITRSNVIRFAAALAWGACAFCYGIPQSGHLPLSVVWVFLPLAFYFVLRAVGRYAVDRPLSAYASIQAAALAGLCMAVVSLCEPQMALALEFVFIAFLVLCKGHRAMLLLIPLPSIVVLAPTFFSMLVQWRAGLWRQLFDDAMLPDASSTSPSSHWIGAHFWRIAQLWMKPESDWTRIVMLIALCCAVLILCAALAGLFVPRGWRISRMMWMITLSGVLLACVAPRVAVQIIPDMRSGRLIAGSPLPGMSLIALGMIMSACSVVGLRDSHFSIAFTPRLSRAAQLRRRRAKKVKATWGAVSAVLIVQALCVLLLTGNAWTSTASLAANHSVLPFIAQHDLIARQLSGRRDGHVVQRILAMTAVDESQTNFTVLSTPTGDLLDRNATLDAAALTSSDATDRRIGHIVAQLTVSSSSAAIAQLACLGFAGIFIPPASTASSARSSLIAHVQASDGTIPVVSNASGVYVRLASADTLGADSVNIDEAPSLDSGSASPNTTGINATALHAAKTDPQRVAWLIVMAVALGATCMLAIPRSRRLERENMRGQADRGESEE